MDMESKQIASYNDQETDFEGLDQEFRQVRLAHQNNMKQRTQSDISRNLHKCYEFDEQEVEDGYETDDDNSEFSTGGNESVATCALSVASTVSSKSSLSIPSYVSRDKVKGSKNLKARLRAITEKITNNRGG